VPGGVGIDAPSAAMSNRLSREVFDDGRHTCGIEEGSISNAPNPTSIRLAGSTQGQYW
jgi:hypothetical protein